MSSPLVSVVIPTYNRREKLEIALGTVFAQDYEHIEIIIINDASTDNTQVFLEDLKKKIVHISTITNSTNLDIQKTLNSGIKIAKGKYVARLDDDDQWLDIKKISAQVEFLESHPEVGVVGTAYHTGTQKIELPLTDYAIRKQILFRSPFCHAAVVFRRDVWQKVGGYDENLFYAEDWDLWLKIGMISQLANLPGDTILVEENDMKTLSKKHFTNHFRLRLHFLRKYAHHYPGKIFAYCFFIITALLFKVIPLESKTYKIAKRTFHFVFSRQ